MYEKLVTIFYFLFCRVVHLPLKNAVRNEVRGHGGAAVCGVPRSQLYCDASKQIYVQNNYSGSQAVRLLIIRTCSASGYVHHLGLSIIWAISSSGLVHHLGLII